jgi:hypothetical protein
MKYFVNADRMSFPESGASLTEILNGLRRGIVIKLRAASEV